MLIYGILLCCGLFLESIIVFVTSLVVVATAIVADYCQLAINSHFYLLSLSPFRDARVSSFRHCVAVAFNCVVDMYNVHSPSCEFLTRGWLGFFVVCESF